jgi:hypothetical protein
MKISTSGPSLNAKSYIPKPNGIMELSLRKKHYFGLFIALVGVVMLVLLHVDKDAEIQTTSVRSDNSLVTSKEISSVCQLWLSYGGALTIEGVVSFEDRDSNQNVFQTSDLNDGIRMEINPDGLVGVIVGNHVTKEFKGVAIGRSNSTDRKKSSFSFQLVFINDQIKTVFNGIRNEFSMPGNVLCDKGLVGSGFDESRMLNGVAIVQFRLAYMKKLIGEDYKIATQYLAQAFILSGTFLVSSFSRRRETIENENIF